MSSILKFIFFNLISFLKNIIAKKKICKITDSNCSREHPARTINIDNSMWGINTIFSEANSIHNHFEHGVFFGDFTQDIQRKNHIERIYTINSDDLLQSAQKHLKWNEMTVITAG